MHRQSFWMNFFSGVLTWYGAFIRRRERSQLHQQLDRHTLRDIGFEPDQDIPERWRPGWGAIDRW